MKTISGMHQGLIGCAMLAWLVGVADAQNRPEVVGQPRPGQAAAAPDARRGEAGERVIIKRLPPPNRAAMVRTPEFTVNVQATSPRVTRRPREWALFEVRYETEARWTDELIFNYHVMTRGKNEEGRDVFSYYTLTIRHIDIPRGERMSCVALPPSLVERHGEPVAIALEIVGKDGTVLDSKSESVIPFPSLEWWRDPVVLDNPNLVRRTGLLDRSRTPFALINADDYEVVQ